MNCTICNTELKNAHGLTKYCDACRKEKDRKRKQSKKKAKRKVCIVCKKRKAYGEQAKYCQLCRFVAVNCQMQRNRLSAGDAIIQAREELKDDKWIYESKADGRIISVKNDCIKVLYGDIIKTEVEYTPYEWYRLSRIKRKKRFFCKGCISWVINTNGFNQCTLGLTIDECREQGRRINV
jgi:hypothetical protein